MRDYKKIEVWKKAHVLYLHVKMNVSVKFPAQERFELTSQLNRAALSVPLNIAEGCGRFTDKDFAHFLDTSLGSINEAEYCCIVAQELGYISMEEFDQVAKLTGEVKGMLIGFIKFLRSEK